MHSVSTIDVVLDLNVPRTEQVFHRPEERFTVYGPEDDWWLKKYGFGCFETRPCHRIYMVGGKMVMHPETFAELEKAVKERAKVTDNLFELPLTAKGSHFYL